MAKNDVFFQCTLQKTEGNGVSTQVSYIPKKWSKVGQHIHLREKKESGGYTEWDDGWMVASVGARATKDDLPDSRANIKAHRARTGDDLPKRKTK